MPHDAGTGAYVAVGAAGAHRRHAVDEFGLTHRFEGIRRIGTVHGSALHEHRRTDIVTGIQVRQKLVQQIPQGAADDFLKAMLRRSIGKKRGGPVP